MEECPHLAKAPLSLDLCSSRRLLLQRQDGMIFERDGGEGRVLPSEETRCMRLDPPTSKPGHHDGAVFRRWEVAKG